MLSLFVDSKAQHRADAIFEVCGGIVCVEGFPFTHRATVDIVAVRRNANQSTFLCQPWGDFKWMDGTLIQFLSDLDANPALDESSQHLSSVLAKNSEEHMRKVRK